MSNTDEQQRAASMEEARREYEAHKKAKAEQRYQDECPHDEHDHGVCLDCGKDVFDDLVGRAELLRDE